MCWSECSLLSLTALIYHSLSSALAPPRSRHEEPRRLGDTVRFVSRSDRDSRTRTVRGAAERKEERRAVRRVAGWATPPLLNLSPEPEIIHSEEPGSLYWQFVIRGPEPSTPPVAPFQLRAYACTLYLANGLCPRAISRMNCLLAICNVSRDTNQTKDGLPDGLALAGSGPPYRLSPGPSASVSEAEMGSDAPEERTLVIFPCGCTFMRSVCQDAATCLSVSRSHPWPPLLRQRLRPIQLSPSAWLLPPLPA